VTTSGYAVGTNLPTGSSKSTVARIKGSAGYIWKATTTGANGDKTDNTNIDQLIQLNPSDCANLEVDSFGTNSPDGKSGAVVINTTATTGTALLLQGYEWNGDTPPDSVDELKTNSNLKWSFLLVGPFNLNASNCNAIVIPFNLDTSVTNL